jgi:hypothetical protein
VFVGIGVAVGTGVDVKVGLGVFVGVAVGFGARAINWLTPHPKEPSARATPTSNTTHVSRFIVMLPPFCFLKTRPL